ncbi:zinc binding dehydrogenase, putative [Talaromyces stipitatus ATCC 10500]|uniref:Zinc binding dehydrogenase, putative n=1 Tax=Talaromyces stipitatus (strain ATCC 10500 / CBS 375.48 / QM 6759 / NRRL 1006) TaxID=441959 RepID=B8LX22_TALSN|nr:zinc binding dehydrogenase, putative [Talaromyces stipitatus ATCC 10500]EED22672.1 zinc binding dehydrogenase, putative [Talaromyces stipitatus ATCC 10500]
MSSNTAAWITEAKKAPLEVKEAPLWTPKENEVLVKNQAVAVNPIDGSVQQFAYLPLSYPSILGTDVAGEIIAVGPNVARWKIGDRIVGHGLVLWDFKPEGAAFQHYTILVANMAAEIPDHISFQDAVVLPLCLSTAATSLFHDDYMGLQLPTCPPQKTTGETLVIWGGASCVGSNGYEVITTASPKNFDYVKNLGADQVFDYSSPTVADDIVDALKGKLLAGILDSIGFSATQFCLDIAHRSRGFKFVSTTKPRFPNPPEGVQIKHVRGDALVANSLGKSIYEDFLPKALKCGSYVAAPKPTVIGKGLESVQAGIDAVMKGVSATKIVITL